MHKNWLIAKTFFLISLIFLVGLGPLFFIPKVFTGHVVAGCDTNLATSDTIASITCAGFESHGVRFDANDLTLTGNDGNLTGAGVSDGILADAKTGTTIIDVGITGFTNGIRLTTSGSSRVISSMISGNTNNFVVSGTGEIGVEWYVTINVSNGTNQIAGASVNLSGNNGAFYQGITNADGLAIFNVSEKNITSTGTTTFTPYTIATNFSGNSNSTSGVTITSDTNQLLFLNTSDNTLPNVTITFPMNTNYSSNISNITYTVVEANPDSCWYSTNNGITNSSRVDSGNNFTAITSLEGNNTWTVYCNDSSNNIGSNSVTFTLDTTVPGVTINNPTATTYTQNNIDINITLSESGSCSYSLNAGSSNSSLTASGNEHTANSETLSNAAYTLTAYCSDNAGNQNNTERVSFSIATPSSTGGGKSGGSSSSNTCSNECDQNNYPKRIEDNLHLCIVESGCTKIKIKNCYQEDCESPTVYWQEIRATNNLGNSEGGAIPQTQQSKSNPPTRPIKDIAIYTGIGTAATYSIYVLLSWTIGIFFPFLILRRKYYKIILKNHKAISPKINKTKIKRNKFLIKDGYLELNENTLQAYFTKESNAKEFRKKLKELLKKSYGEKADKINIELKTLKTEKIE